MISKNKVAGCIVLAALLVLLAAAGASVLIRTVPGVARLVSSGSREPTALPARNLTIEIATATLTPRPSAEPSAARKTAPTGLRPTPAGAGPAATPTAVPAATRAPQREWIAFESKRGKLGDYEICVMATDGSRVTNLTNSWADDVAPAWSPDGRWIAFVSLRDTLSGKAELESGNLYVLPFDPASGKATGDAARLTDFEGAEGWPAWSPDGTKIAFHADKDGNFDIWVMNVDGTGLVNLTRNPADDRYPAWSPDGTRIAFASTRDGEQFDVYVMDAGGSTPVNLTRHPARDRYPIWSPDGTRMTFNTDRAAAGGDGAGDKQDIYVMSIDPLTGTGGSDLQNITRTPKWDEGLADWSPDGKQLVLYSEQQHNKDIYLVELGTDEWTNLTNDPASDEYCAWWP